MFDAIGFISVKKKLKHKTVCEVSIFFFRELSGRFMLQSKAFRKRPRADATQANGSVWDCLASGKGFIPCKVFATSDKRAHSQLERGKTH